MDWSVRPFCLTPIISEEDDQEALVSVIKIGQNVAQFKGTLCHHATYITDRKMTSKTEFRSTNAAQM